MGNKKIKLQAIIFDKDKYTKARIRIWISMNGFIIDSRLRQPIMRFDKSYRVRQRNPNWFNKKTFISLEI